MRNEIKVPSLHLTRIYPTSLQPSVFGLRSLTERVCRGLSRSAPPAAPPGLWRHGACTSAATAIARARWALQIELRNQPLGLRNQSRRAQRLSPDFHAPLRCAPMGALRVETSDGARKNGSAARGRPGRSTALKYRHGGRPRHELVRTYTTSGELSTV